MSGNVTGHAHGSSVCPLFRGDAYTCGAGGLAPLRSQAASPGLPTSQPLPAWPLRPQDRAHFQGFHSIVSTELGAPSPLGALGLCSGWLGDRWMQTTTEALCFSAQTSVEVGGARPRAQSPAQTWAWGPHRPRPPWAGGLHPHEEEERAQPASPGDNGFQPPACPPPTWRPGGRLKRCGNNRGASCLL